MRKIALLIYITLLSNFAIAQKTYTNKVYGFSIQEPKNWIVATKQELVENLDNFDLSDEKRDKLLSDNKGALLLTSYYKYNQKNHPGLIPTIQVNVIANPNKSFENFKKAIVLSLNAYKQMFPDFEFTEQPKEITISGLKGVVIKGKFSMKAGNGEIIKVRSMTYAIPYKNYFFQIDFSDGQVSEDCSKEFDDLIKSIKIGK